MENQETQVETLLTLQKLKDLPESAAFATGVTTNPRFHYEAVRWVAKRGLIHDWAIYYQVKSWSARQVMQTGEKCISESIIRELVPCDDEAFKMYRY